MLHSLLISLIKIHLILSAVSTDRYLYSSLCIYINNFSYAHELCWGYFFRGATLEVFIKAIVACVGLS